jgi:hypothetical protein
MTCITSNLSTEEQQVTATTKRKEEDAAMAQAVMTTVSREKKTLLTVVDAVRKTVDEARAREHATALDWEKEKTNARHLE